MYHKHLFSTIVYYALCQFAVTVLFECYKTNFATHTLIVRNFWHRTIHTVISSKTDLYYVIKLATGAGGTYWAWNELRWC